MMIPSWLVVWKFLQSHDPDSLSSIAKQCDVSWCNVRPAVGILDDIGLVNTYSDGNRVKITKTQKYHDTKDLIQSIYDAVEASRMGK